MITPDKLGSTDNPDELANLIDQLMAQGTGHVNISSNEGDGLKVDTVKSTDICGKGACCQPTEEDAVDEELLGDEDD